MRPACCARPRHPRVQGSIVAMATAAAGCGAVARSCCTDSKAMLDQRGAAWFMAQETRALLARLARVKPFALHETMVPAAALLPSAQIAIEQFLAQGRQELRNRAHDF